jgi:hypothetical protein
LHCFKKLALLGRIAFSGLAQLAEIAAVSVEQHLRGVAQHARGALVVTGVACLVQGPGALLPGRCCHLVGGPPALGAERPGRLQRQIAGNPRAQQDRRAKPAEQRRRRALAKVDPELRRVGLAVMLEQSIDDAFAGWSGHRSSPMRAPTTRSGAAMVQR